MLRCLIILIFFSTSINAQNLKEKLKQNTNFSLYVKDLHTTFLFNGFNDAVTENRIHQRLKFKWYVNDNLTTNIEWRNQFIYGGFVSKINDLLDVYGPLLQLQQPDANIPISYAQMINTNESPIDLSWVLWESKSALLYSQIDRLWLQYAKDNYILTIGRQRINWGINWVWNPNDLFNASAFLDFDYEERPGTDAIRFQYYTKKNSKLEIAFHPEKKMKNSIAAMLFKFNKKNYDFQSIAGYYQNQLAIGGGWAGHIKKAGFKAEFTYLQPLQNQLGKLVSNIGFDYSFQKGILIQAELLYNQYGVTDSVTISDSFLSPQNLSVQNLWTYKWAIAAGGNYSLNPRLSVASNIILNPTDWSFFIVPSATVLISDQFDWLLLAQFTQKQTDATPSKLIGDFYGTFSTRLRWSF